MTSVSFRFIDRLNTFLALQWPAEKILYRLEGRVAVKHPIEALGVPHTEVEVVLVNGHPVDFAYILQPDDDCVVYPANSGLTLPAARLRPPLPYPPCFVADNHLGRLVTYLRLLGFDTLHPKDLDDQELAELSSNQDRVLLTRDRRLLMRKIVVYGFCLQTRDPRQQLSDVLARFDLRRAIRPWHRCLRCNGQLRSVAKEDIIERLELKTKKYYHDFHICRACDQIYWKGSHYPALDDLVSAILSQGL